MANLEVGRKYGTNKQRIIYDDQYSYEEGEIVVPSYINKFTNLYQVCLYNIMLSGDYEFKNLSILSLRDIQVNNKFTVNFNGKLSELNIVDSDKYLVQILGGIDPNTNIDNVEIEIMNTICMDNIVNNISNIRCIKNLNISNNTEEINGIITNNIGSNINKFTNIKKLHLIGFNNIHNNVLSLTQLKLLDLDMLLIEDYNISEDISKLTNLKILRLKLYNNCEDEYSKFVIHDNIGLLTNLKALILEGSFSIPDTINNIGNNLEEVYIIGHNTNININVDNFSNCGTVLFDIIDDYEEVLEYEH